MTSDNDPKVDNSKVPTTSLPLPLTLKDILQYGEKVGELQNVPTYVKLLTEAIK